MSAEDGRTATRAAVSFVALGVGYYAAPVDWTAAAPASGVLLTLGAVAAIGWAITAQVRHDARGEVPIGLPSLAILLALVVVVFALGYLALETARPGEFVGLATRTDSLYFTLQVLSTVGLGDVHAAGQTARLLVSVQMVFDLVFVAAAVGVMAGRSRRRAGRLHAASDVSSPPVETR